MAKEDANHNETTCFLVDFLLQKSLTENKKIEINIYMHRTLYTIQSVEVALLIFFMYSTISIFV